MRQTLKLAWRNVWRNRRRSLITMSAILFSVLIITLTRSLQYGSYDAMEAQAVRLFSGDIQLQTPQYREEETFEHALDGSRDLETSLLGTRGVEGTTRRLTGFGLLSSDATSTGALIIGVEPEREQVVTDFIDRLDDGEMIGAGPSGRAMLGRVLARNLHVTVGDSVVVLTQGYQNQMGAEIYEVAGLLDTGSPEMDRMAMILSLSDAQILFAMDDRYTQVVVRTADFRTAGETAGRIDDVLPDSTVRAYDWDTLMPELRQMIVLDNVSGAIFLAFLLVLVGFEIFNTTTMSVMEREREFGVLQALGMKPSQLARLVTAELSIKIALSLVVSMALSGLLLVYLEGHPIPLTQELTEMYEEYGFRVEELLFSTRRAVFLEPLVSVAFITVAAALYPIARVFSLETVTALRRGT